MAGVAEVDLVEGEELLAVVEDGPHHRADGDAVRTAQQRPEVARGVGDQHTGVPPGLGVDPDDRLPVEVLGHVGHEPVLAHDDDHVVGGEEEAGHVGPLHAPPPPVDRDLRGHGLEGQLCLPVALLELGDVAAAGAEEERRLPPCAVGGDQLVVLGAAVDHDDPRRQAHDSTRPLPSCASARVTRSGLRTRVSICGRFAASSFTASASRTASETSR